MRYVLLVLFTVGCGAPASPKFVAATFQASVDSSLPHDTLVVRVADSVITVVAGERKCIRFGALMVGSMDEWWYRSEFGTAHAVNRFPDTAPYEHAWLWASPLVNDSNRVVGSFVSFSWIGAACGDTLLIIR